MPLVFTFKLIFACLVVFSWTIQSHALLAIPNQLTLADRQDALKVLGTSTSVKIVGDPYPLGGFSGILVGLTLGQIATQGLGRLGSGSLVQPETRLLLVTLGKGLFYNVDFFLQFAPPGQSEEFTNFGAAVKWAFYESPDLPFYLSLQIGGNGSSFQNLISTTTQSFDLLAGYNFIRTSLYSGVGIVRASGLFMGGAGGVTDTNATHAESLSTLHYILGVSYKWDSFFVAGQFDRAGSNVISLKMGLRF